MNENIMKENVIGQCSYLFLRLESLVQFSSHSNESNGVVTTVYPTKEAVF
jgi:hypothetical protein